MLFLVVYRVLHTIMHVYINRDKLYLYLTSRAKTRTKKSTVFTTSTTLICHTLTLTTTILFIDGIDYCSFPKFKVSPVIFVPAFCLLVLLFEQLLCWQLAVTWSFEPRDLFLFTTVLVRLTHPWSAGEYLKIYSYHIHLGCVYSESHLKWLIYLWASFA